jgi:hypothetical protein
MHGKSKYRPAVDRIANAAMPIYDETEVSERLAWWWIFFMPGKVILWIEYMFPKGVGGAFGSARRRNVPLIQVLYSIGFYLAVVMFILLAWILSPAR